MIKRINFAVAVKPRNLEGLLKEVSVSAKKSKVVFTEPETSQSQTLASLRLIVEGEDFRVDAFEKQVKGSPLVYRF